MNRAIEHQKLKLKQNLERLQQRQQENTLLAGVVRDYKEVYSHMKTQDDLHESQLQFILQYLRDIRNTNQLTETGLKKVSHEKEKILDMLQNVKQKISHIV